VTSWDTNWLVRHLLEDDAEQLKRVRSHLSRCEKGGTRIFLPLLVLVETNWVLRSRLSKQDVLDTLEDVIGDRRFRVESEEDLEHAISCARKKGDLSDHLIAISAQREGALPVHTFDNALKSFDTFKVP
jgi:predicted nucleic-acid-binding protein